MGKTMNRAGGFAALNTGRIENCCSAGRLTAAADVGVFCGENRGTILHCFSKCRLRGKNRGGDPGLCARQSGDLRDCLRVSRETGGEQDRTVTPEQLHENAGELLRGWDTERVWHLSSAGGRGDLELLDQAAPSGERARVVEISDAAGLLELAQSVNAGASGGDTLYRLTCDLDLKGREFTPVGADRNSPFCGGFDGCGHTIRNFRISAKKNACAGLFGYLGQEGEVRNLNVDCMLSGRGDYSGALCGINEGCISNCATRSRACYSRYTGGLVGHNAGTITCCCAFCRLDRGLPFPWWLPLLLMALLFALLCALILTAARAAPGEEVFAPVIIDPNAVPVDPDDPAIPTPPPELPDSGAGFVMNTDMFVSSENYAGAIGLRCPGWSHRGFVATAVVKKADLVKNGAAYQQDAVVYQSGLLKPGFGIDVITLGALPDGSRLPAGSYELTVQLNFYDIRTNERASVNSTVPLQVTVG